MATDLSHYLSQMTADELCTIVSQVLDAEASPIAPWSVREIGRGAGTATAGLFILAGWTGNDQQLKLTYLACLGTCEAILSVNLLAAAVEHPGLHGFFEEMIRCPIEEGFERWAEALRFFLTYHGRALQLTRRN